MRGAFLCLVALVLAIPTGRARAERVLLSVSVAPSDVEQAAVYDFVRTSVEAHGDQVARVAGAGTAVDGDTAITLAKSAGATAVVLVFVDSDGRVRMQALDVATGKTRADVETSVSEQHGLDAAIEWLVPRVRVKIDVPVQVVSTARQPSPTPPRPEQDAELVPMRGEPLPPEPRHTSTYAWQVLLFDAAALGIALANLDTDDETCWGYCSAGGVLALGSVVALAPAAHVMNGRPDAAGASIGLRLGIPAFAIGVFGLPLKYGGNTDLHPDRGKYAIQVTAAIGIGVAIMADTTFAFTDPILTAKKKKAAKPQQALSPLVIPTRDGVVASVGGTF